MARLSSPSDLAGYGALLMPEEAQEPILSKPIRSALLEWLTEIWCAEELREVGLEPRRRAVFSGAPGTGKTTLAHHLAARLGIPMLVVRPEKILTSYVSASAAALGKLFDILTNQAEPVLVFFDEFDSLAAKRMGGGRNEVGEQDHNLTVNTLLAAMDRYTGFIVAATNYADRVDEAVWRRFDIQIDLALPGDHERRRILERYFAPFILPEAPLALLAESLETASPALMRAMAENIKRQIVVGPKAGWTMDRASVFERVLTTVKPHPDLGLPRLWSRGVKDAAVARFPWPLAKDLAAYPPPPPTESTGNVVHLGRPPS